MMLLAFFVKLWFFKYFQICWHIRVCLRWKEATMVLLQYKVLPWWNVLLQLPVCTNAAPRDGCLRELLLPV